MKYCIALNRSIIPVECVKCQRELPSKFCAGCSWFKNLYILKKRYFSAKRQSRYKYKAIFYKVKVSQYLRQYLLKLSDKQNITVSQLITNILRGYAYGKEKV